MAMTPQVALRLIEERHAVALESGVGMQPDSTMPRMPASTSFPIPIQGRELVVVVGPPAVEQARRVPEGATLVGFLDPFNAIALIRTLTERRITAFEVESIPRTTPAQSIDALSSQATVAGYHFVALAAAATLRFFPMLATAAGTIPPPRSMACRSSTSIAPPRS